MFPQVVIVVKHHKQTSSLRLHHRDYMGGNDNWPLSSHDPPFPVTSQLYRLSPRYFTMTNDSNYDFPWWQLQLPPLSPYDNIHDNDSPFHHLRQPCFITNPISTPHDLQQPISITSPIPFPSQPRWCVPMLMQQENIFTREQVCVTVAWWHVSLKRALLADVTTTHPCNPTTTSKPP